MCVRVCRDTEGIDECTLPCHVMLLPIQRKHGNACMSIILIQVHVHVHVTVGSYSPIRSLVYATTSSCM